MNASLKRLLHSEHSNPFEILSWQASGKKWLLRLYLPSAENVSVVNEEDHSSVPLSLKDPSGIFEAYFSAPFLYRVVALFSQGGSQEFYDPYYFSESFFGEQDLYFFSEGTHLDSYRKLGAIQREIDGIYGYNFAVWAPNALRVSVVGDFNHWDGRIHQMRSLGSSGIWELFIPEFSNGSLYKFEIKTQTRNTLLKSDPYGRFFELRPATASITLPEPSVPPEESGFRHSEDLVRRPVSIYEVHSSSWKRPEGMFPSWEFLSEHLVSYVKDLGFTHIELLPISEHPLDSSWGYQSTGFYAPTSRHGSPDSFQRFIDSCHREGIGVILDWTPAHFPKDAFALYCFDGTHLYEHEDPRLGEHPDWHSAIFNYGRKEVAGFLLGSALQWFDRYGIDGLRVDAVASMLYRDYSREPGQWFPNRYGGKENLEAIELLKRLNTAVYGRFPHAFTVAEESTSFPGVTSPVHSGGLGFGFKWNMGWMHDSLFYMKKNPVYRKFHHQSLTFSLLYAFSENFILPLSHDEVVHGKGSLLSKMPGDRWQKFANLRLLFCWQFLHPGKKLLFMGGELGQWEEWDSAGSLSWNLLNDQDHRGIHSLVRDLNRLYSEENALFSLDTNWKGFEWIDFSDIDNSIISFVRWDSAKNEPIFCIFNFTPQPRNNYRIGLFDQRPLVEIFNSDSRHYAGTDCGNGGVVYPEKIAFHGKDWSVSLMVPPLAALVLKPVS
ncbi:MAG: 1,4-alpha-glucan branching protein GlgB [Candidatus Ratteibacteria bacterium]|jgi:1,4-alpha-glucan branching enzyme